MPKNPRSSERGFFYPSRRLGISLTHEVRRISSRARCALAYHHAPGVYFPAAWRNKDAALINIRRIVKKTGYLLHCSQKRCIIRIISGGLANDINGVIANDTNFNLTNESGQT